MKSYLPSAIFLAFAIIISALLPSYAQETAETRVLSLNDAYQATLKPKETHRWQIKLKPGQFAAVEVLQQRIDVVARILDPEGKQRDEFNNPMDIWGKEKVSWIADKDGIWQMIIAPSENHPAGEYEIKLVGLRKANEKDRMIVEADSLNNRGLFHYGNGAYARAELLFKQSLEIRSIGLRPEHPDVAASKNNIGVSYIQQGKYEEAEPLLRAASQVREKILGSDHPDLATSLNDYAVLLLMIDKYSEADSLFKRSVMINEKALGPDHPHLGASLGNWALLYYRQAKYTKAEPLNRRALAIFQNALGDNHPEVATALNGLARLYRVQRRYAEAEPLSKRALAIKEKSLGPDHRDIATDLSNLAFLYMQMRKHDEAEPLLERSLAIREKTLGAEHPQVATALLNLALLYRLQGEFLTAEPFAKRALTIRELALGPSHPDVARTLLNLALLYKNQGKYTEAEPLATRSLAINEKILGQHHPNVAQDLNSLASIYHEQGKYASAEELFERSLAIREKAGGSDHPSVAPALHNLALLYQDQGKYAEAEPLYKRSLAINEKILGPNHPNVAHGLSALAGIFDAQGKQSEAESLYTRSLAIREQTLGPDHPAVAASLNNLAAFYAVVGKTDEAEPLYRRALAIDEKTLGPHHPDVAADLKNLAFLYMDQGKHDEAEPLFKRSLAISQMALGHDHPDLATALGALAHYYHDQGRFTEAESLLLRAIQILDNTPGHPENRIAAYVSRAQVRKQIGNSQDALYDLSEALKSAENSRLYAAMRPETRGLFFEKYVSYYGLMIRWLLEEDHKERAFEYAEKARIGVLSQAIRESESIRFAGIPDGLLGQERDLRIQLTAYETNLQKARQAKDSLKIGNLENRFFAIFTQYENLIESFESDFPRYYDLKYQTQTASFSELQNALDHHTAVIEYFVGDSSVYIFTFSNQAADVIAIPKAAHFDQVVDSFHKSIKTLNKTNYLRTSAQLYDLILKPIENKIATKEKLVIIPDEALYYVPFEALITDGQHVGSNPGQVDFTGLEYLIEKFEISYHYSATLFLKSLKQADSMAESGMDNFIGFAPVFSEGQKHGYILASNSPTFDANNAGLNLRSVTVDGQRLNPLKYSQDEVISIVELFKKEGKTAFGYFHGAASEKNFKLEAQKHRFVHIATHSIINEANPKLSSIVFAQPTDSSFTEDGVLYAGETYNLDLNADLVALSSCESGIGKLIKGEGLMALTRGFLYSGARNILFSLWAVSDRHTSQLMTDFYHHILTGKSYGSSLRYAKLNMIKNEATAFPIKWSAFVLIGSAIRM